MAISAYETSDSLEELRYQLTRRLGYVLIGFGILGAWYFLLRRDLPMSASGLLCLVIALGRGVQLVLEKHPVLARHLLVWGIIALLVMGMWLSADPLLPYLGVLCVFASAMLVRYGGFVTAAMLAAISAAFVLVDSRAYPLLE